MQSNIKTANNLDQKMLDEIMRKVLKLRRNLRETGGAEDLEFDINFDGGDGEVEYDSDTELVTLYIRPDAGNPNSQKTVKTILGVMGGELVDINRWSGGSQIEFVVEVLVPEEYKN